MRAAAVIPIDPSTLIGEAEPSYAISPLSSQQVGTSLLIFIIVYFLVFGTGIYYMLKLMAKGPDVGDQAADVQGDIGKSITRFDHRPMSRATDPIDE